MNKKEKILTTDEYIDGRNEIMKKLEDDKENDRKIKEQSDHFRMIEVKTQKKLVKFSELPEYKQQQWKGRFIFQEDLEKPAKELISALGNDGAKWNIKKSKVSKYNKIYESIIGDYCKDNDILLVDIIYRDIITEDGSQYYSALGRGIDKKTLEDFGLKQKIYTEKQKANIIKKVITKIDKEWQIHKI